VWLEWDTRGLDIEKLASTGEVTTEEAAEGEGDLVIAVDNFVAISLSLSFVGVALLLRLSLRSRLAGVVTPVLGRVLVAELVAVIVAAAAAVVAAVILAVLLLAVVVAVKRLEVTS
jgi:hypothetical protein